MDALDPAEAAVPIYFLLLVSSGFFYSLAFVLFWGVRIWGLGQAAEE
jgi:hypothetical protein